MMIRKTPLAITLAALLSLAGCSDGDDGAPGAPGEPGSPGQPGAPAPTGELIDQADLVTADITAASLEGGTITVDFTLTNAMGTGVHGLDGNNPFHDFRFSIAQLAVDGEAKAWHSLLNEATNELGTTFEQGFEKIADCPECLTDNGDGTYQYRFATDLSQWQDPAGVEFDADLTQRIAIEMQFEYDNGKELAENVHYDWIPATGSDNGVETRQLVSMDSCYDCHQVDSLKAHGGRRLDLENCQSCHNPLISDPNGVSVDLGHMVHAIHMGPNRSGKDETGAVVDMPYTVQGYHGLHAFDYPMFPTKPFMDCASCHKADPELADADLWLKDESANACMGCHTDSPVQHNSAKNPDLGCTDCHSGIDHNAARAPYETALGYSVTIENVEINVDNLLEFDVTILDDQGNKVDQTEVYQKGYSNPYVVVSWDVEQDYPAQTVTSETDTVSLGSTYDHRRFSLKGDGSTTFDDTTKVFSVTTEKSKFGKTYRLDVPADIATRSLEILPVLKVCFEEHSNVRTDCNAENAYPAYVQNDAYRTILDEPEVSVLGRREIVDDAKCYSCHGMEFYHDSNGVNCIACHTNDKKLVDVEDKQHNATGKKKSSSFLYKAHKAEGHHNGFGGSGTVLKTDCLTCHTDNGFELGRNHGQAVTVPESVDLVDADAWYASADVGACMSCHQKYLSEAGIAHVISNGGYFGASKGDAKAAQESCAVCHDTDNLLELHGN